MPMSTVLSDSHNYFFKVYYILLSFCTIIILIFLVIICYILIVFIINIVLILMNNSNDFIGTASAMWYSKIIINTNTDYFQITEK